jgi:hypothetical protein
MRGAWVWLHACSLFREEKVTDADYATAARHAEEREA